MCVGVYENFFAEVADCRCLFTLTRLSQQVIIGRNDPIHMRIHTHLYRHAAEIIIINLELHYIKMNEVQSITQCSGHKLQCSNSKLIKSILLNHKGNST